jgi:CTP synthase
MLTKAGLKLVGMSPDNKLVEIIEAPDHPWFVAVQFHPELKSRPTKAHPLFRDFVATAVKYHQRRTENSEIAAKNPVG